MIVGSDYPYPLGERPAGKVVRQATFLGEPERRQILRENAEVFLGRVRGAIVITLDSEVSAQRP